MNQWYLIEERVVIRDIFQGNHIHGDYYCTIYVMKSSGVGIYICGEKEFKGVKTNLDIVIELVSSYDPNSRRILYADRAFGSLDCVKKLLDLGYYVIVFVRKIEPSDLFSEGLHKLIGEKKIQVCYKFK